MSTARNITTDQVTVGSLFKTDFRYFVPPHQRDFAWRPEEEVAQLWEDILEAMKANTSDYFLGTIVVTENANDKTRSVIDGQQRLAALSMIFAAIRSIYFEHDDDRNEEVYAEYLGSRDRRSRLTEPKLTLNKTNEALFQGFVVEYKSHDALTRAANNKKETTSNRMLLQAARLIRERVMEQTQSPRKYESFLLDIEDFLRDRVVLILVAVGDEADAYLIFETLNDRGLELSISDLLKNYIYGRAGSRLTQVQTQWDEMSFRLGTQDATQFLRHYWLSNYGVVRERDLYRELRKKFTTGAGVLTLMSELREAADHYAAILNPDHATWNGYSTGFRRNLETLDMFGLSQFRPLLLAAMDSLSPEHIEDVVEMVVVISMRYNIIGSLTPSAIERAYSDAAVAIRRGAAKKPKKVFSILKGIYPDDKRFRADFSERIISKARLARYILTQLANKAQGAGELEVVQDEQKVTLEHIMPKGRNADWVSSAADEEEYKAYVDRLGNLALVERATNRGMGNSAFDKKKVSLAKSKIKITKDLASFRAWKVADIEKRQKQLADLAVRVWRVD